MTIRTRCWRPESFFSMPGATAYGDPVRTSSIRCARSFSAARWSRDRPYGPKSALMCTRWTSYAFARYGTTAAGLPLITLSPGPPACAGRRQVHTEQPSASLAEPGQRGPAGVDRARRAAGPLHRRQLLNGGQDCRPVGGRVVPTRSQHVPPSPSSNLAWGISVFRKRRALRACGMDRAMGRPSSQWHESEKRAGSPSAMHERRQ
jgi:hypothetical protein